MTADDDPDLHDAVRRLSGRVDPIPERVVEAARAAFGWRDPDTALAALTAESALTGAGVRGGPARLLSFEAGGLLIEVEVSETGTGGLRLMGQLVPPGAAVVRAEQPDGAAAPVEADQLGRFRLDGLATGPTRLVCRPAGSATWLRTEWTVL